MSKLIVIEGTDCSGKQTQSDLLFEYYQKQNKDVLKLTFPDYESESSSLVRMYLEGQFGSKADSVDSKTASVFYAVDRYASYKTKWEEFSKKEDSIIVFDRYVTSNMIHQAAKISNQAEKDEYLNWIYNFEYNIMGLPKPDKVIFLNMSFQLAQMLMEHRKNKITNEDTKDIHERDCDYLKRCYDNACYVAEKYAWCEVKCFKENNIKTREEIHEEIINIVE